MRSPARRGGEGDARRASELADEGRDERDPLKARDSGPIWQRAHDTLADLGIHTREEAGAWVADHRRARRGDSAAETEARAGLANIVEHLAAIVFDAA